MSKNRTAANTKEEIFMNRKLYYVGSQNNLSGMIGLFKHCHKTTTSLSIHPGRIIVPPGEYKYLFDCNIPDECHTSVEEDKGFIRYSVTVVIDEDDDKKKEFVESFTVINPLNLNDDETYSVRCLMSINVFEFKM